MIGIGAGKGAGASFPKPAEHAAKRADGSPTYAFGQRGGYGYGFEQPEPCFGCRSTRYRSRSSDTDALDVGGAFLFGTML